MRLNKKKNECCGCTACKHICPHDAITMEADVLGFLYPKIDNDKCIDCGLCEKVCSFSPVYDTSLNFDTPYVYAVRHKDEKELSLSQSGGAFVLFSDKILDDGGVVYGAGFEIGFRVTHQRADTKRDRDGFRGSKYVQSDLGDVFKQVRRDLRNGFKVLFSGTPCQTSGLLSYIGSRLRENLYVVDLVCHGVPSPSVWRDYLSYIEKRESDSIEVVNFRDKSFGWASSKETYQLCSKRIVSTSFGYLFYKNIMLRESCYVCPFTNLNRPSDVTIADFWGWTKISSDFNDNKGVSLVLINTEKGKDFFDQIQDSLYSVPSNVKDCLQPQLQYPSIPHPSRHSFELDYKKHGFEYVAKKYGDQGWRYQIKRVKNTIKRIIKKIIGRK